MWLVSGVVRRYIIDILIIIITFPYSTCISSFFGIIPISLFIFKCFFVLYILDQVNFSVTILEEGDTLSIVTTGGKCKLLYILRHICNLLTECGHVHTYGICKKTFHTAAFNHRRY